MSIEKIKEMIDSLSESEYLKLKDYFLRKRTTTKIITIQDLINDNDNFTMSSRVHKLLIMSLNDYTFIYELKEEDLIRKNCCDISR